MLTKVRCYSSIESSKVLNSKCILDIINFEEDPLNAIDFEKLIINNKYILFKTVYKILFIIKERERERERINNLFKIYDSENSLYAKQDFNSTLD